MKTYELSYIVSPEITSEEAEAKAKEIESAIKSREGMILKQSNPIAKTLSYPIKKRASGFFGVLEFQLEPEKLIEIKNILEKDGKIVRHMVIIKLPSKPRKERRSKPSPAFEIEKKTEIERPEGYPIKEEKPAKVHSADKEKVELKDIEQKLEELLGE
jgi:ribosomal protein S6